MKQKFTDYSDYLFQMAVALTQHSLGNLEDRELKDARVNYIFEIAGFLLCKLGSLFESILFTDDNADLYTYSEKPIEKLQKDESRYKHICTSKNLFVGISKSPFKHYKYHYKIQLQKNCYGIDVNNFFSIFSDKEILKIYNFVYNANLKTMEGHHLYHEKECEVILKVSDIKSFEKIKL